MGRIWVGADPGGNIGFGVAIVDEAGKTFCVTVSSVHEAVNWIDSFGQTPCGIGIDAPLWWSAAPSGERLVDKRLRGLPKIHSNSVLQVNSLMGSALAGGALLASMMRERFPNIGISESHPKALLQALCLTDVAFANRFDIDNAWNDEHQRDAAVGAVCARQGFLGYWKDLAVDRNQFEQDPKCYWLKPVHYWWPAE